MTYFAQHVTLCALDLRSNSDIGLLRSICSTYVGASWRQEHDAGKIMSLSFFVQKLFGENHFCKKCCFDLYWSVAQPASGRQILLTCLRKSCKRAIECFFHGLLPILGSEIIAHFRRNMTLLRNLTFGDLWWPQYWWERKNDRNTFERTSRDQSNVFPHLSIPLNF